MADIKRIYEIEISGVEAGLKELSLISTTIDTLDLQVINLKKELNFAKNSSDTSLVSALAAQIKSLQTEIEKLTKQKSALTKETTLLNQAENTERLNTEVETRLTQTETTLLNQNTEATSNNTKATKQSSEATEDEEEKYISLSERIKQLNLLREQLSTTGKPIVFEGVEISSQDASSQVQKLITLRNALNAEIQVGKNIKDQENIAESQSLFLLTKERQELEAILAAKREGSTAVVNNEVLSYDQIVEKLNSVKNLEETEKTRIENLTTSLSNQNVVYEEQVSKYKQLVSERKELTDLTFSSIQENKSDVTFKGEKISIDDAIVSIKILKEQERDLNSLINIRPETIQKEASAYDSLISKRKELNNLILSANVTGDKEVTVNGEVLSLQKAIEKRDEYDALIDVSKQKSLSESEVLEKQLTLYDQLIARRKALESTINEAVLGNFNTVNVANQNISIERGIELVKEMKAQEQSLIDQFKIEKGVHDAVNIAEENSITKLKQQAALLQTILANRSQTETTVSFQGSTLGVDFAQKTLAQYQNQIQQYNEQEKLRKQAIDAVDGSMKNLEIETKLLTQANIQLTASNKDTGLNLNQTQYESIRKSISGIIPEINNLSLADVNAGKASDLLTQKIFANNAALRDYKLSISGSNTLVGDYTKGITDAFKNLGLGSVLAKQKTDVDFEITQILSRINDLRIAWETSFKNGGQGLEVIEKDLREATVLHTQLTQKVGILNNAFESTNTVGNQLTSSIGQGFEKLGNTIGRTLLTYVGFQAAISGVQRLIQTDKELSDQNADLARTLGSTAEETQNVTTKLKELDTRTSLTQLQSFAIIAARAGVATEKIAGVTSAINKLQLVAGSELGDIDTATTSIVKLINIFQGAGNVTEESVLKTGNALIKLSNEGVASGQFLVEFSERLAGIRGATGISQSAVLGLAAAFEETGQTSEVAATSISQVLNRVSQDVPKFAALAGQATEKFRATLRNNPAEAVLQLAEGLRKGGTAADELGVEFDKLGLTGVRVRNTLQVVGANIDFFRKRISDASSALQDQSTILEGSAAKQETFAATIDKIGASLTKAFDNPVFVNLLNNIGSSILGLINLITKIPFQVIIVGISAVTAGLALYKGQVISTALAELALNKQSAFNVIGRIAEQLGLVQVTEAQRLKVIATEFETAALRQAFLARELATGASLAEAEATTAAAFATTELNTALKFSPIGIFLAALALIIPLVGAFAAKTEDSAKSLGNQNAKLKQTYDLQKDLAQRISDDTIKTKTAITQLVDVIKDENANIHAREEAYNRLIEQAPEFTNSVNIINKGFADEAIQIVSLNSTYDLYIKKLEDVSKSRAVFAASQQYYTDVQTAQQKLLQAQIDKQSEDANNAEIERQNRVQISAAKLQGKGPTEATGLESTTHVAQKEIDDATTELKVASNKLTIFKSFSDNYQKGLQTQLNSIEEQLKVKGLSQEKILDLQNQQKSIQDQINNSQGTAVDTKPETREATIESLKKQLEDTNNEIKTTIQIIDALKKQNDKGLQVSEARKKLDALNKTQSDLKKQLKQYGIDDSGDSSSTGRVQVERDEFNELQAIRDRDIAAENLRFAKIVEVRKATLDEQIEHLKTVQSINDVYDNDRISKLEATLNKTISLEKNASGQKLKNLKSDQLREEKELAESQLAVATRQVQTNEQVLALKQKSLDDQIRIEKKDLEARKSELQSTFSSIELNPESTNLQVANAHKELDDNILKETILHYNTLLDLANKFNLSTETLEDEKSKAVSDILRQSLNDERNIYESYFKDIDKLLEKNISTIRDKMNFLREDILNSNKPSQQQSFQLETVTNVEKVLDATEKLNEETQKYQKALNDYEARFSDLRNSTSHIAPITKEQVEELHNAVVQAKIDLKEALDSLNAGIQDYSDASGKITSVIGNLFSKIFKVSEKDLSDPTTVAHKIELQKLLAETVADTFQTAQLVMNNYFDAEHNRIEQSNQLIKNRLDLELTQQKARSQSQAESDALDREYAQKKKDADRKTFEEDKKLKIAQAKINLGTELSNIALTASIIGLATLGIGGIIFEAIQAGLAVVRYISNVSTIQSSEFTGAYGLSTKGKGNGAQAQAGGIVKGNTHAQGGEKFVLNGTIYEDEVNEIRVIRTKNADPNAKYNVSGTQGQIASFINQAGGGIGFEPGAIGKRLEFGGSISYINKFESGGSALSLSAPSNSSSFLIQSSNPQDIRDLKAIVSTLAVNINQISKNVDNQTDNIDFAYRTVNRRIDNIKVHVVAKEVKKSNDANEKATSIGTIR